MKPGYIKLWRKLLACGVMKNKNALSLFVYILLNCQWESTKYTYRDHVTVLGRGECILGRKKVSEEIDLSEQEYRTALKFLEKLEIITTRPTTHFTVITVVKYGHYQDGKAEATSLPTNDQPTVNQRSTTIKEGKKEEEGKNLGAVPEDQDRKPLGPVAVPPKGMTRQELQAARSRHYPKFDPRHPGYGILARSQKTKLLELWEATQGPYTPVPDFDVQKYLKEHPRG